MRRSFWKPVPARKSIIGQLCNHNESPFPAQRHKWPKARSQFNVAVLDRWGTPPPYPRELKIADRLGRGGSWQSTRPLNATRGRAWFGTRAVVSWVPYRYLDIARGV